jgi:hypothetical protein
MVELMQIANTDGIDFSGWKPLPGVGMVVRRGWWSYEGELVRCTTRHERKAADPKNTPNLFSTYRDEAPTALWVVGESVTIGVTRRYESVKYVCLIDHITSNDSRPDIAPEQWEVAP